MSDVKLKPCPFCGSDSLSYQNDVVMPDNWHSAQVMCGDCETVGPSSVAGSGNDEGFWCHGRAEAQDAADRLWNKRHTPEGWQAVPVEPDLAMIAALGWDGDEDLALGHAAISNKMVDDYKAALAVAPKP